MPTLRKGFRRSAEAKPRPFVRDKLHPRVIYFPPGIIDEHDKEPGQLIALVTSALTAYLKGKGVRPCR